LAVEREKAERRIRIGQDGRDHAKRGVLSLPVKCQIVLGLLPGAHAGGTEHHGSRPAPAEVLLQGLAEVGGHRVDALVCFPAYVEGVVRAQRAVWGA